MLRKILLVGLSLLAFLGGAAAGELLRRPPPASTEALAPTESAGSGGDAAPAAEDHAAGASPAPTAPALADHAASAGHGADDAAGPAWFKFPQQFFVPILYDGRLDSTMILTLSIEMPVSARETVHAHEIKLRDALLRQLLIHANTGGFDGNFTTEAHLRKLRSTLTTTVQSIVPDATGILIGDIARQER